MIPHFHDSWLIRSGAADHLPERDRGFRKSIQDFEDNATWLTAEHAPALVALRAAAYDLDTKEYLMPSLLSQFNMSYRALVKAAPTSAGPDPVDDALDDLRG